MGHIQWDWKQVDPWVRLEVGVNSFFIARGWRFWSLGKKRCLSDANRCFLGRRRGVFSF
jgi:hypothetical protein